MTDSWTETTLGEIIELYDHKRIPLNTQQRSQRQGEYPYYGAARIIDSVDHYIFDGRYLLIAEDGSVITTEGKAVLQLVKGKFWVSNHAHVVQGKSPISTDFLYFAMSNVVISGYITGTAQPKLSQKNLKAIRLSLPPLPTQRKIATVLSAYDDLIENNTRRIEILEEMAQAIYREWFVEFHFPGHEQVEMVESELGLIPQGWEVVRTEQIIKRVQSGKKYDQKTVKETGDIPVLDQGQSGLIGYHNNAPGVIASEDEPIIVFANHTCYQRIIQFPFSAIQNVLPFLPHPEKHHNIYWLHWATKDLVDLNDYKGHWPEFMSKEFPLPPAAICEQFGEFIKPMVQLTYRLDKRNQNLRQTRDLLLPKLISGEIDVSELDIDTD